MKKSTSNLLLFFSIIFAVGLIIFYTFVGFKALLLENKAKLEDQLSLYLKHNANIESIIYIPPNVLIIKNISVAYAEEEGRKGFPLFVKSVRLSFSLRQLLEKKSIVVHQVVFSGPRIDYNRHEVFFKENIEGIIKAVKFLARGRPLKLVFEKAEFIFGRRGSSGRMFLSDASFKVGLDRSIKSMGRIRYLKFRETDSVRKVDESIFAPEFSYDFQGEIVPEGISIARIEVESAYMQTALQGEIIKSVLKLKGSSTFKKFYGGTFSADPNEAKKLFEKIRNFLRYGRLPRKTGVLAGGINVLDINCLIKFDSKHITAQKIGFYLNNIPVSIQGKADFEDGIKTVVKLSTFADQNEQKRAINPQRLDIALKCSTKQGKTSGETDIVFLGAPGAKGTSSHRVQTSFSNLSAAFLPDTRLKLLIEKMAVQYSRNTGVFNFMLSDFGSMFSFMSGGGEFVEFNSKLYDGTLEGYITAEAGSWPPKINYNLSAADVSAWQLDALLLSLFGAYRKLPAKLQGRIDGQFTCELDYVNHPEQRLKGKTMIKDGFLDNITFFVWLGDFFGLEDLKKIEFSELSARFDSTPRYSVLENIKLNSEKLTLEGNFLLNSNEFVTSNITIALAREYLKNSSKFNTLLGLMDDKTEYLSFDFQLSGIYRALNFKWQKSAFKQRLEKMLPGFVERGLERKVERAIQSITPEKE